MVELYKISHLSLNDSKSTLCLCYNKGVRTYSMTDFSLINTSNNSEMILGDVSLCELLHELNIIVFTGTENNEHFNNKKLVIYNMKESKILFETNFEQPIIKIKSITKYLFILTGNNISLYNYNVNFTNIKLIRHFFLVYEENPLFDIWLNGEEINKIFLCRVNETGNILSISSYFETQFDDDKSFIIKSDYQKIQNFFYIQEYKIIFIVDNDGKYFTSYSFPECKKINEFYRGKNIGVINSIIAIYDKYIAVSNLNKTIHIYPIDNKSNNSIASYLVSFIKESFIYSCLKIRINEIVKETNFSFFQPYFIKYGSLLYFDKINNNFISICYNGFAYIIKINLLKMSYQLINKINFVNEALENLNNSIVIENSCIQNDFKKSNIKLKDEEKSFQVV